MSMDGKDTKAPRSQGDRGDAGNQKVGSQEVGSQKVGSQEVGSQEVGSQEVGSQEVGEFEPKIIGFLCNWCSYTGADLAGTSRIQYPPNIRVIKVMCSGRVNPQFVMKAFQEGADGVLVSGCHPGDCHYIEGNFHTRRKLTMLRDQLEFMGIEAERFQISWVSASEGIKFAEVVSNFTDRLRDLGPQTQLVKRGGAR